MKKRKASGPVRMKQLGRKKVEVWLSERQWAAFEELCQTLDIPKATLARRCINYAVEGGQHTAFPLTTPRYD